MVPLSAVVARPRDPRLLHSGEHGSTFAGNPLAAAIGTTVVFFMLTREEFQARSAELCVYLRSLIGDGVLAVRGLVLWAASI